MLLPICISLTCINRIESEKRNQFFNINILPVQKGKLWLAKVCAGCFYLFSSNTIVFSRTTISGILFGAQYSVLRGIAAALVLTITWAWQIHMGMFLSAKFSPVITFSGILGVNVICSIQPITGGSIWFIPFAILARLMAPILGINPNGVSLALDSSLHDFNVMVPGILITLALFAIMLLITKRWFNDRSE